MSSRPYVRLSRAIGGLAVLTLAAVAVAQPVPAQAEAKAGRYIVSTYSAAGADETVATLAKSGTRPRHRFDRVFTGFSATLTPKQVVLLRRSKWVRSVAPDQVLRVDTTETNAPWGLDRVDSRSSLDGRYSYATTGAGVSVFELDTGIRFSHEQFGGRARSGWDFVDGDNDAEDCQGHGTHVAGTVAGSTYGVAKEAEVVALRVLDCAGEGYESDFEAALQWVIDNHPSGPSVVNISAGGDASPEMDAAVAAVIKAGIPVAVAAGNEDSDACDSSPARAANALTVGATDRSDRRAGYSNYGRCVDVFAPGSSITSASLDSDTATEVMSGTSMATPHVAGAVARYLQANPKASPAAVRSAMLGDASGGVSDLAGSPNKLLFLRPDRAGATASPVLTHSDAAHTATLTWQPPYGFGAPAPSGYRLTRSGTDTAGANFPTTEVGPAIRSYTFANLKPGSAYTATVQPLSSAGAGTVASKAVTMLALPGPGRVSTPSAGSTKDGSTRSITARWKAPSSGGAVASYAIEVRRVSNQKVTTAKASGKSRSQKVTKLSKNATYQVRVRAVNAAGRGTWSGWSGKAKAR